MLQMPFPGIKFSGGEDAPDPPTIFHKVSATELWLATDWTAIFIPFWVPLASPFENENSKRISKHVLANSSLNGNLLPSKPKD